MRPFLIEEIQVATDLRASLGDSFIGSQIDLLVFERPPQPLDKDVVAPGPTAIHAEGDLVRQQQPGERSAVN